MRTLDKVIDQILKVIPKSEDGLREELTKIKDSFIWASPETKKLWWGETQHTLGTYIGKKIKKDWQREVIIIWTGKK